MLYPNPALSKQELSQQLLEHSPQDSSHKVALMVVGTVIGNELAGIAGPNTDKPCWWQVVFSVGKTVVWHAWDWAWHILRQTMATTRQLLQR